MALVEYDTIVIVCYLQIVQLRTKLVKSNGLILWKKLGYDIFPIQTNTQNFTSM